MLLVCFSSYSVSDVLAISAVIVVFVVYVLFVVCVFCVVCAFNLLCVVCMFCLIRCNWLRSYEWSTCKPTFGSCSVIVVNAYALL